ncbi:MBL fold metallo-hydrolase RNA specificity domain-containing protein [Massilia sp. TS11]|uniref:MBL fold metallo-hydrolase RNA specificity domain-containing protein n=1 Tax=Massilia sp. TS11 TaxID=2908003 RepID=UPI001EDAF563|nr:MBL fold metallo-hydrolase [Massilia sp. TS11]MCG2583987.1 MBL fold metallo-hydrolase [Massilia sp. TS11]
MRLQFLGAAGTVTGSKYLVRGQTGSILVDCGLFQGYKNLRLRNRDRLPVPPSSVESVVLTHAHLDHSGYLPLLVKDGFSGVIHCSEATYDLCKILLPDSGRLLEEEANFANRHHYSRHSPALPLYTEDDAFRALKHFRPVPMGKQFSPADGLNVRMQGAGHILGAASVLLEHAGTTLCFSGDLGRPNDPLMAAPDYIEQADYLVVESTYGDRVHDNADPAELLAQVINSTCARGGVTIIPAFAVGRAQTIMYYLQQLKASGRIPALLPVWLDSPMATDATALYRRHRYAHRLNHDECQAMCQVAQIANTPDQSRALDLRQVPMVIIAASGMATGGRVLHHLRAFLGDTRNTVLFAGFQAAGTRGAAMIAGAPSVKIFGEYLPVRAQVSQIGNLSAHADAPEIIDWLRHFKQAPRQTYVTHGEPQAADALRLRIEETLHWRARVPEHLETVNLS